MTRPIVLAAAAVVALLTVHPWTWATRGMHDVVAPAVVLAIVAIVVTIIAFRLGDLRLPARSRPRPVPPARNASDATRAAEELIRHARRRR